MAKFIRRLVDLGIAREATRGVGVAPTFWVPKTGFSFNDKSSKVVSNESLGVIADAGESFITEKWGEGDVEGEIRDKSFGLFLYSLLGSVSSAVNETTAYDHTFTISQSNQHQSLSFLVDDPIGDVIFKMVMLNSLTINVNLGEIANFAANFVSRGSDDYTDQTPSYTAENKFVSKHATIKIATNLAGLAAASALEIKNISITFEKNVERDHILGQTTVNDIFNKQISVEGEIELTYEDRTYRDHMLAENFKALRIDLINNDVTIGASTNPELQINLPRVHFFDWEDSGDNDEIAKQTVKFKAFQDISGSNDIISSIVLTNETTSY